MQELIVSVVPTYRCSYHCPYCYLGDLRKKDGLMDLEVLDDRLSTLKQLGYDMSMEVFGGDLEGFSDIGYINALLDTLERYSNHSIGFTTMLNDGIFHKICERDNLLLSFSLNEERGKQYKETLERLNAIDGCIRKRLSVMSVVLPSLIYKEPNEVLDFYESLGIKGVSFLQYYKSRRCKKIYNITNEDYEKFMISIIETYKTGNYTFKINNLELWYNSYNPLRSSNIFIMPNGKYATLEYDKDGYESFLFLNDLDEYENLIKSEIIENKQCLSCGYFGKCLAEHIRPTEEGDVCSGLPNLRKYLFEI